VKSKKIKTKYYSSRTFRVDLHQRLKVLAAKKGQKMEDALNDAVAIGLTVLEKNEGIERREELEGYPTPGIQMPDWPE
jgi:hypothetical protein